ncbi:MAG TPA: rod shape-determining protein MreD [Acetobacteraceae bacterium]|nr:rod shape-determining protein MreD [Acetobacteraceae bacterium]
MPAPDADRSPGIRPRPTLRRQLDAAARQSFPIGSTVALMLLGNAPLGGPALLPAVTITSVFFWSLYRPGAMPPPAVFLLGLLLDLLGWLPMGDGIVVLLLVHGFCVRWRRSLARQGFLIVWLVFVGFAVVAAALIWAIAALLLFRLLPIGPAMFQAMLTAALYPAFAILLTAAYRTVADPERA